MKTPIELARKYGAEIDYSGIKRSDPANIAYEFDAEELDAHSRALVEPYVEALQKINDTAMAWPAAGTTCGDIARQALAAHREMFGGE